MASIYLFKLLRPMCRNTNIVSRPIITRFNRQFTLSSSVRSKKDVKKLAKPKKPIDAQEISQVVSFEDFESQSKQVLTELKDNLNQKLTLRATTTTIEQLKIEIPKETGCSEPYELRDIAQISIKNANLVVINLSAMPEALKPTYNKLYELGNMNPQIDAHTIFIQMPKVTREYREKLAKSAEQMAKEARLKLKAIYSDFSRDALKRNVKGSGLSKDLIMNVIDNLKYHTDNKVLEVDKLLNTKTDSLLNKSI